MFATFEMAGVYTCVQELAESLKNLGFCPRAPDNLLEETDERAITLQFLLTRC